MRNRIIVIGAIGGVILYPYFENFEHMIGLPMPLLLGEIQTLFLKLMVGVLVVLGGGQHVGERLADVVGVRRPEATHVGQEP